ncbi:MAG: hypothetical protein HY747_11935 [Elusimicrobia bacterium]|nr:hypothetical protein [Elusimicrobiota bacterium]
MEYLNATSFRNHIDRYLKQAQAGADFIVTLFGKPAAYVGPWQEAYNITSKTCPDAPKAAGLLADVSIKELTKFDRHCRRRAFFSR